MSQTWPQCPWQDALQPGSHHRSGLWVIGSSNLWPSSPFPLARLTQVEVSPFPPRYWRNFLWDAMDAYRHSVSLGVLAESV